jgi:hypothetical protein
MVCSMRAIMRKPHSSIAQDQQLKLNSVSLKLSHLQPDFRLAESQADVAPIALPSKLKYTSTIPGQDDIDTSISSRLAKRKLIQRAAGEQSKTASAQDTSSQRRHTAVTNSQQKSMEVGEDHPLPAIGRMSLETRENVGRPQVPDITAPETQGSTQTREDRATRGRLARMVSTQQAIHPLVLILTDDTFIPSTKH